MLQPSCSLVIPQKCLGIPTLGYCSNVLLVGLNLAKLKLSLMISVSQIQFHFFVSRGRAAKKWICNPLKYCVNCIPIQPPIRVSFAVQNGRFQFYPPNISLLCKNTPQLGVNGQNSVKNNYYKLQVNNTIHF